MCRIDFFEEKYKQEDYRNDGKFGLCDNGELAYSDISDNKNWIATVVNSERKDILFTPVDKNIVAKKNGDERSQCDGMLTLRDGGTLIFVELKSKEKAWISKAINQLKSTIVIFKENHDVDLYRQKVAYAANNKKPNFQHSKKNTMLEFREETGFRLLIEAKIIIK